MESKVSGGILGKLIGTQGYGYPRRLQPYLGARQRRQPGAGAAPWRRFDSGCFLRRSPQEQYLRRKRRSRSEQRVPPRTGWISTPTCRFPLRRLPSRTIWVWARTSRQATRSLSIRTIKPQRTDNFTVSIQRQITSKTILEVGYIGRKIANETSSIDLDAVPYMTTLGGQTFANAYAATFFALQNGVAPSAIAPQAFFENALGSQTRPPARHMAVAQRMSRQLILRSSRALRFPISGRLSTRRQAGPSAKRCIRARP